MKTKKQQWTVLLFSACLPLVAVSVMTFGMSFRSKSTGHPQTALVGRQPDSALPSEFAVTLLAPAAVGGQALRAGEYEVDWWQDGDGATLSFKQADTVQAIAHGRVETRTIPAAYSVVLTRPTTTGGVNVITEMQFQGKRSALVLTPTTSTSAIEATPTRFWVNMARMSFKPGRNAESAQVSL